MIFYLAVMPKDYPMPGTEEPVVEKCRKIQAESFIKAETMALLYEMELNDGKTWNLLHTETRHKVRALSLTAARKYASFDRWPGNR